MRHTILVEITAWRKSLFDQNRRLTMIIANKIIASNKYPNL